MIVYEDMTPAHFAEWGVDIAPHASRLLGWACRRDGYLVAMGFVLVEEDDRWWASFIKRDGFPPVGIHRHALSLFAAMDRAGVDEIFATADPAVHRSREWLERLGFERVDDEVWKRGLSLGSDGDRRASQSIEDAGEGSAEPGRVGADGRERGGRAA